tara:strand:+ start:67 stop:522 length:456 start_codon:yes stop_codon:yes gene_type:complete
MKKVQMGSAVNLHYKGTFTDGQVFEDSRMRGNTMPVLVGAGKVMPAFEAALIGMTEGQTKKIKLTSAEAYGPRHEEAVITTSREAFPDDFIFQEGLPVSGQTQDGRQSMATIVSFTDTEVTLDHNHPLAGKDLNFEIELVKISDTETSSEE